MIENIKELLANAYSWIEHNRSNDLKAYIKSLTKEDIKGVKPEEFAKKAYFKAYIEPISIDIERPSLKCKKHITRNEAKISEEFALVGGKATLKKILFDYAIPYEPFKITIDEERSVIHIEAIVKEKDLSLETFDKFLPYFKEINDLFEYILSFNEKIDAYNKNLIKSVVKKSKNLNFLVKRKK